MNIKGFTDDGLWYRGNLHSHTINSDGHFTPEQSAEQYRLHGYSFVCFSEHDYYTDNRKALDSKDFIVLPGLEASTLLVDTSQIVDWPKDLPRDKGYVDLTTDEMKRYAKSGLFAHRVKTHHIHGILGTEEMQKQAGDKVFSQNEHVPIRVYFDRWDGLRAAQELSDSLVERGCFTTYNHPIWSRVETDEVCGLSGVWAIECYNYNTVNECCEGEDTVFWDAMLRKGTYIRGFASDDNHNNGVFRDSFGGYVMVKSPKLNHESIVTNLLEGNYYFSNGAVIKQWGIRDGRVYIQAPDAVKVDFICGGYIGASKTVLAENGYLPEEISVPLTGEETYVRVQVRDLRGRRAWTNAMMMKIGNEAW